MTDERRLYLYACVCGHTMCMKPRQVLECCVKALGPPLEPLEPWRAIVTLRCVQGEHNWCERWYEWRHLCQCQCHNYEPDLGHAH